MLSINCKEESYFMFQRWSCVLFLMLATVTAGTAQPTFWQQTLPEDTTLFRGTLDNGLQYFIKPHSEPENRVEFRLVVQTGSLQEDNDQLGVAHFVEHMAFNGTERFAKNTLVDFIERSGSTFGADLNAYTSFAETVYQLQVQTDSLAVVDTALQILQDWAQGIRFDSVEVDKERGIVISEWRSRLSSSQRLQQQTFPVLYQNSRFADRLPIGDPTLIDTVPTQRLIDYYKKWYQPRHMAIVVVGDIDPQWMESEIQRYFKVLKNTNSAKITDFGLDTTARRHFVLATDEEAPFTEWRITRQLSVLPKGNLTMSQQKENLLYGLFSSMINKRLAKLREQAVQPFTFASLGFGTTIGNHRSFSLSGFTTPEQVEASLTVVAKELERVRQYGFTEKELELVLKQRTERLKQLVREYDKVESRSFASSLVEAYLDNRTPYNIAQIWSKFETIYNAITLADFEPLYKALDNDDITTAIIKTTSSQATIVPDSTAFFTALQQAQNESVKPYLTTSIPDKLVVLHSIPETEPVFLHRDTIVNVSVYELANGVQLYLKPTSFKNDEILLKAASPGGLSLVPDSAYASGTFAVRLLDDSGLDSLSAITLYELLSGQQVRLGARIGQYEEGFLGHSNGKSLETLFQLLHLHFTKPRFDSLAVANFKEKQREIFERIDTDPRSAFGRMVIDEQYGYHPRRPNITLTHIDEVDLQLTEQVYKERFANPADFKFIVVGNFDTEELLGLANRYLSVLPTSAEREEAKRIGPQLIDQPIDTTVVKGKTPKVEVQLVWHGSFPVSDRLQRYAFVSLRRLLNIRLREELREELGGVYGVRITRNFSELPDSIYSVRLRFNADEEMADTLLAATYRVLEKLSIGDFPDADIDKIKAAQLQNYEEVVRKNSYWLHQISRRLMSGQNWEGLYPEAYPQLVENLSKPLLAAAVQRYLLEGIHFRFLLKPE